MHRTMKCSKHEQRQETVKNYLWSVIQSETKHSLDFLTMFSAPSCFINLQWRETEAIIILHFSSFLIFLVVCHYKKWRIVICSVLCHCKVMEHVGALNIIKKSKLCLVSDWMTHLQWFLTQSFWSIYISECQ